MREGKLSRKWRRPGIAFAIAALVIGAGILVGCGSSSSSTSSSGGSTGGSSDSGGKLDVVGYSTPESVYEDAIEPAFNKTAQGSGVSFSNSFGASGDQARAVEAGQPASIVHFSTGG